MAEEKIKNFLLSCFNLPHAPDEETGFFKGVGHKDLCHMFGEWFRIECHLKDVNINNVNIQGIHDRGIDLIAELDGDIKTKIGVQIKCDNDIDENLQRQIDTTLANFDTFYIDYVIIIFCGDYTDRSHKTKVKQEIARIEQKSGADKFIIIEPTKAFSLFNKLMPLRDYLNQFKELPINHGAIRFCIIDIQKDESGFPIINIESDSFLKNEGGSIHIVKAYISTIIGLIAPDIMEIGFLSEKGAVLGIAPIEQSLLSIIINERLSIKIPAWFFRGLEEFGPISFWGSGMHQGGETLKLCIQLQIMKREYLENNHYKLMEKKFYTLASRLQRLGYITI